METVGRVATSIKLSWGAGALGVSVLMNAVTLLILFYMVSVLEIEPALAGTLIFVTKMFDVISDPVVGLLSDRFSSRIGRRRPFLIPGAIISSLAFVLIFATPQFENQVFVSAYIFAALIIYTLGYTVFNVPYMAMPAEMTDDYHERSSIHAYRVVFVTSGSFIAGSIAPWLLEHLGRTEWSSYLVVGLGGGVIILVSMLITFFGTGKARYTDSGVSVHSIKREWQAVSRNGFFLRLIGVKACQLIGVSSSAAAFFFLVTSALQLELNAVSYYYAAMTVASVIAAPIIVRASKIYGKRNAYIAIGICYVLVSASWHFTVVGEPLIYILVRGLVTGVALSGNILLAMSMLTDTIDYDARKTGVRREGAYTSLYSFTEKVTFALGPLLVGVAMSLAGFERDISSDQMQPEAVTSALLFGTAYIPAGMGIVGILILLSYKLDQSALDAVSKQDQ